MTEKTDMREALANLLAYAEQQVCQHENTYRGGSIWEVCKDYGKQWVDDRGGKPEFAWPAEIADARAALAARDAQATARETEDTWSVPPRWYSRDEVASMLKSMNYCDQIAEELADWALRHFQLAFNKGFEKGARDAAPKAQGVAEGWKLVPVERSYDMREKAIIVFNTAEHSGKDRDDAMGAAWRAMLATAPSPDREQVGEVPECCGTPAYCSSVRRCTAKDASPSRECGERPVEPEDIDAVAKAIEREALVGPCIAQSAAVAAIDTLIARGNHSSACGEPPAENAGARNKIAAALHYPDHWDTAAYPTLDDAVWEAVAAAKLTCSVCRDMKPASPADQAVYQAIADNYARDIDRECGEPSRPLSDFERVVLEYIAFNDGFINTRIRAEQLLEGRLGECGERQLSDDEREAIEWAAGRAYSWAKSAKDGTRMFRICNTLCALLSKGV